MTGIEQPAVTIDTSPSGNRERLHQSNVLAVALVGPPGAGKTALIEATARQLRGKARIAVITVNPAADRDAGRISQCCGQVVAVNTGVPDAAGIRAALDKIDLSLADIVFIESLGGVAGAPDLGQDLTVTVLSITGGDDKAAEYAKLLKASQLLILSKAELQRHVAFDLGAFRADARRINSAADLIEISAFENTGFSRWLSWLEQSRENKSHRWRREKFGPPPAEVFLG